MLNVHHRLFSRFFLVALVLLCQAFSTTAYSENPQIKLQTDRGDIVLELYPQQAPVSVENFIKHTNGFHYDGSSLSITAIIDRLMPKAQNRVMRFLVR